MPNTEYTQSNIVATIPSLGDPANVVTAFEDYHTSIAGDIDAKANKANPTFTGTATFATVSSGSFTATSIASLPANTSIGSVSAAEIGYLDGLTGSVQSQLTSVVAAISPTGSIMIWSTNTAPSGWLICNGATVSRTTYATLFAVIGTTYGAGDGSTTFVIPNLMGRVPFGRDANQPTEFGTLGAPGGAKTLTIAIANLPAHNHSIDHTHGSFNTDNDSHSHGGSTSSGGSHTHTLSDNGSGSAAVVSVGSSYTTVADNTSTSRTTSSNGSHSHSISTDTDTHNHSVNITTLTGFSGNTGSGTALPSLPPYIVLNYIIKT
jgi:microcystin-dependent protein